MSLSNTPDTEMEVHQQIMLLRDITVRTGAIHEAQVVQLKLWPYVAYNNVEQCEIHIHADPELINKSPRVEYRLITKGRGIGAKPQKRHEAIALWTRELLGDAFEVVVFINGKEAARIPRA